jgi:hypothetical protein
VGCPRTLSQMPNSRQLSLTSWLLVSLLTTKALHKVNHLTHWTSTMDSPKSPENEWMSKLKTKAKWDFSRVSWDFDQDQQRFLLAWQSNTDFFLRGLHTSRNYMFKTSCIGRESNPGLPRGRREFYHWTTNALEYWEKAGNRIIKLYLQAYVSICGLSYIVHLKKSSPFSPSGNWTPVSRVTGGDTHHYTNEELVCWTFEKTWSIGTNHKFAVLGFNPSNKNICIDWMVRARSCCDPSMECWDSHEHVHVIDVALYHSQATQS